MRMLFVCDLNSVHSQKWIKHFSEKKHEVHIYSTTPFDGEFAGATVFCRSANKAKQTNIHNQNWRQKLLPRLFSLLPTQVEYLFRLYKPLKILSDIPRHVGELKKVIARINPDIIHCLRIPNEGFIGMFSKTDLPLAISTWGNDLTYWARFPIFGFLTKKTLLRCDFLFSDCERDIRYSRRYGFSPAKPFLVVPGAGGMLQKDLEDGKIAIETRTNFLRDSRGINGRPIILSLRGFGSQGQEVNNIPLLKACKILSKDGIEFKLVIAGKRNGFRFNKLSKFVRAYSLGQHVFMVDEFSHLEALKALGSADFSISVAKHDGTPNSMLEAMTFGAIPLMSDIESVREWITDGVNGYLFDPEDAVSIANTIKRAITEKNKHPDMRMRNLILISDRANYFKCMSKAESKLIEFLQKIDSSPR
jgi:glycosyltransferase involved in cell wall biosynthesis